MTLGFFDEKQYKNTSCTKQFFFGFHPWVHLGLTPQNATLFLLYVFGKAEEAQYKFTTVDVKQTQEGIEINQAKYCESFNEIEVKDKRNMERELT